MKENLVESRGSYLRLSLSLFNHTFLSEFEGHQPKLKASKVMGQ
jgi:hypothetical protein